MRRAIPLIVSIAIATAMVFSCGEDGPSQFDSGTQDGLLPNVQNLTIEPADVALKLPLNGSIGQSYKVFADVDAQKHLDVTAQVAFSLEDQTFGSFIGPALTVSGHGGVTKVRAVFKSQSALSNLSVILSGEIVVGGAPPNSGDLFSKAGAGSDASRSPLIEYPIDRAIAPLNIPPIESQWTKAQNDLFHLSWKSPHLSLDVYTTEAEMAFDPPSWQNVALTAQGETVNVFVEGMQVAQPTTKYGSASASLKMSHDRIDDTAIYYWASSKGNIMTQTFGATSAPTAVKGDCTSCHSMSNSGSRIGYSRCVGNDCNELYLGFMKYDTTLKTWTDTMDANNKAVRASYTTFSPLGYPYADDTQSLALASLTTCQLELFNPDTGSTVASNVIISKNDAAKVANRCATMPSWGPDGKLVAFASTPHAGNWIDVTDSAIATMTYELQGTSHVFGDPTFIVKDPVTLTSGTYNNFFFPSFSPDGKYILINAARAPWRDFTVAASPGQRLLLTDPKGSFVIDLTNANGPGDLNITWPHWAPNKSNDYYWFVFASERNYGHRITKANSATACKQNGIESCKQIWLAAIDKATLTAKSPPDDPSAAPMWMPGQDIDADNISPYWTVPTSSIPK